MDGDLANNEIASRKLNDHSEICEYASVRTTFIPAEFSITRAMKLTNSFLLVISKYLKDFMNRFKTARLYP